MENMIKTHALFQLLSDVRFLTNIFIYVKHGRVLRPGIAHETGTPPSCRNSKLTNSTTAVDWLVEKARVATGDARWRFGSAAAMRQTFTRDGAHRYNLLSDTLKLTFGGNLVNSTF